MNNKRIRMDIILGIPHSQVHHTLLNEVADFLCQEISTISAGCTLSFSHGFWSQQGDEFLESYHNIDKQDNIHVHVTVLEEKQTQVFSHIQQCLRNNHHIKELGIQSVHIETYPVCVHHLSL